MTVISPREGPEALAAYRQRVSSAPPTPENQRFADQKLLASYLRGEMGSKLLDLLEWMYDGDTFNADPYEHARAAGARSVYLFLKDLKKENPDG